MADIEAGKVPVQQTVIAAWRFTASHGLRLLPAAAILGVFLTVLELAVSSLPAPNPLSDGNGAPFMALEFMAGVLIRAFFAGVILRLVMRETFSRPTGLQFGADERRLFAAQLGAGLVYLPVAALVLVTPAALVFHRIDLSLNDAVSMGANPQAFTDQAVATLGYVGAALLFLLMLGLMLAMVWILVRLCLIQAASFAERRIVVLQSWKWTHHNFLRVALAHVLTFVPATLVASMLLGAIADLAAPPDADASGAALVGLKAISNVLAIAADIPTIALMAYLYRGLRPPEFQAR